MFELFERTLWSWPIKLKKNITLIYLDYIHMYKYWAYRLRHFSLLGSQVFHPGCESVP